MTTGLGRTPSPERREVRAERLLGRRVVARNDKPIGRLEEFRTEMHGSDCVVTQYVIGVAGLLERLGVGVRLLLGIRTAGYLARWDQIDISNPERPRLTCPVEDLERP